MIILAPEAILAPTCIECTLRSSSKIFGEIISGHTCTSVLLTTFIIMKGKCTIFNWQGLGGWPKSIPHIVLVVHLHNLHAKPVNYDNNNRLFPGLAFIDKFFKNFGQIFSSYLRIFESVTMQLRLISHRKINKLNTKKIVSTKLRLKFLF